MRPVSVGRQWTKDVRERWTFIRPATLQTIRSPFAYDRTSADFIRVIIKTIWWVLAARVPKEMLEVTEETKAVRGFEASHSIAMAQYELSRLETEINLLTEERKRVRD